MAVGRRTNDGMPNYLFRLLCSPQWTPAPNFDFFTVLESGRVSEYFLLYYVTTSPRINTTLLFIQRLGAEILERGLPNHKIGGWALKLYRWTLFGESNTWGHKPHLFVAQSTMEYRVREFLVADFTVAGITSRMVWNLERINRMVVLSIGKL